MKIEKISTQGLKNDFLVTFPLDSVTQRIDQIIAQKAKVVRMDGFRPGKVPLNLVRQRFAQDAQVTAVDDLLNMAYQSILKDNEIKPATSPVVNVKSPTFEEDLVLEITVEGLPKIELNDFKSIKLDSYNAEVTEEQKEEAVSSILKSQKRYKETKKAVASGNLVVVNLDATIDGKPFDGMTEKELELLVSVDDKVFPKLMNSFVGKKKDDSFTVEEVLEDASFFDKKQIGKTAVFNVKINAIKESVELTEVDEQLLQAYNMQTVEQFMDEITSQLKAQNDKMARLILKRQLLDMLDDEYQFDTPESLREQEFNSIWQRLTDEVENARKAGESDIEELTEDSKAEYTHLAERRVRLGLLIGEIAKQNKITVPEAQVRNLILQEALKYRGQEKQVLDYIRSRPQIVEHLKAPALEDLVIDFIVERATLNTKDVSLSELKGAFNDIIPTEDDLKKGAKKPKAASSEKKETKKKKTAAE
jgi:trigger factor